MNVPRLQLIAIALEQHAEPDSEWSRGWFLRLPGGWEFGPCLPRLWRWAITLKCIICIVVNRQGGPGFYPEGVEIAAWDGERHNGYPEADYHEWKYLKTGKGWHPNCWFFEVGREST